MLLNKILGFAYSLNFIIYSLEETVKGYEVMIFILVFLKEITVLIPKLINIAFCLYDVVIQQTKTYFECHKHVIFCVEVLVTYRLKDHNKFFPNLDVWSLRSIPLSQHFTIISIPLGAK